MSFSANPYAVMELITAPPKEIWEHQDLDARVKAYWEKRGRGAVDVHCGGCGAQDVAKGAVTVSSPIALARQHFDQHISRSHDYQPADMVGWSWES